MGSYDDDLINLSILLAIPSKGGEKSETPVGCLVYGPGLLARGPLLQVLQEVFQGTVLLDGAGPGKGTDRE